MSLMSSDRSRHDGGVWAPDEELTFRERALLEELDWRTRAQERLSWTLLLLCCTVAIYMWRVEIASFLLRMGGDHA